MATIRHRDNTIHTSGQLPAAGTHAPDFRLTLTDLRDTRLGDYTGKWVVLNIFPSIDTSTCATSVRRFNQLAAGLKQAAVLCVSKDLPFAHKRFCGAEGIGNVICASQYKDQSFTQAYCVEILEGTLTGLMSRAVVVIDPEGVVRHAQQVPDIGQEPDYEAALAALPKD